MRVTPHTQALSLHAHACRRRSHPDNVAFDARGALLVAGHPHFQALVAVAANRYGRARPQLGRVHHADD
jgi:hypothetical protein